MSVWPVEAREQINTRFQQVWVDGSAAIVGYVPAIVWQGATAKRPQDASKFWCRLSMRGLAERQASLSACVTENGKRRYEVTGQITVQLFCPRSANNGFEQGLKLADVAKKAFRGFSTPGGVWFYNVRTIERPVEDAYYRFNVVSDYEHDYVA